MVSHQLKTRWESGLNEARASWIEYPEGKLSSGGHDLVRGGWLKKWLEDLGTGGLGGEEDVNLSGEAVGQGDEPDPE